MSVVEKELEELLRPTTFYAVCSPEDPVAIRNARIRRADHEMWQAILPGEDTDLAIVVASLRKSTGHNDSYIEGAIHAHRRLHELPRLQRLQQRLYHLDLPRLRAIDRVLCKLDATNDEHMAIVDEEIATYLTPRRANQNLPSPSAIRAKLNAIIQTLDTSVSGDDSPTGPDTDHYRLGIDGNRGYLELETDAVTAQEIDLHVRAHASTRDISLTQALVDLIRGNGRTNVTLNVYRATDVVDAPAYIPGIGWAHSRVAEEMAARATSIRDMDELYDKVSTAYRTPDDIRAVVIGLDGVCGFPSCQRPGHHCQMDHRINHEVGGPTTASNLVTLCQYHHNLKTDGRVRYIIDPDTREIVWLFDNGQYVIEEPAGPLSPHARNWLQTVGQRTEKRRARIRAESQIRKATSDPPRRDDDPPPF
ncbi:HNH endonuclease signature motif containing protein [Corynebacterium comes]|nr:HNH endonuclease signature motif containing protein [Corynebacterium comes]